MKQENTVLIKKILNKNIEKIMCGHSMRISMTLAALVVHLNRVGGKCRPRAPGHKFPYENVIVCVGGERENVCVCTRVCACVQVYGMNFKL